MYVIDPTEVIPIVLETNVYFDSDPVETYTTISWYTMYNNDILAWRGLGITEFITNGDEIQYEYNVPDYHQTPSGTEAQWDTFAPTNYGWFYDYHDGYFDKPLPESDKYHVAYIYQRFELKVPGGYSSFGSTYIDYEYIDSTPSFHHDEHAM